MDKELIEKEEQEIYPEGEDSKKCDKEVGELYKIKNWADLFYYGKPKLIKDRFLKVVLKSEHSKFFKGLDYEYGINNKEKDIKKAFEIYKNQADNGTDVLSMYKLYHIYRNDFKNFGFSKRDKILEKYYLFKSYSYLSKNELEKYSFLFNRFNIPVEVKINLFYEDRELKKFDKLIKHLNKYINYYKIKIDDLLLVEAMISFQFKNNHLDKAKALEILKNLISKENLEAIYKTGIIILKDGFQVEKFFEILENKNYYRSFCDYAIYLYQVKKDNKKALKILQKAILNGVLRANYLFYDIFLNSIDFSKIEINKEFKESLLFIFNLLINDISTDGLYSYFEYFYLRKLCIKHWGLKSFIDNNLSPYTKEFCKILIDFTSETKDDKEIKTKKELINDIFQRDDFFSEFHLSCGIIYYYGIDNLVNRDLEKSLLKFQISFDNSNSKSYKRFCYSYISRIKQKLFDKNNKLITLKENEDSKKQLFDLYNSSIDKSYKNILSSSFFYYLSRLYSKKWGNPGNDIMEYICLKKALEDEVKTPGTGTIISYYRKNKSKIILDKKGIIYNSIFKKIIAKNDSEGYGEDNSICPVCMEYKRNIMFLPCKHQFCEKCTEKLIGNSVCPICRGLILFHFDYEKIKEL